MLLPLCLARGVTGVALGLLLGLKGGLPGCGFLGLTRDPRGLERCRLFLATLLVGLFRFARCLGLGALGRQGLALGATSRHRGIVLSRLRLEFVQKILAGVL